MFQVSSEITRWEGAGMGILGREGRQGRIGVQRRPEGKFELTGMLRQVGGSILEKRKEWTSPSSPNHLEYPSPVRRPKERKTGSSHWRQCWKAKGQGLGDRPHACVSPWGCRVDGLQSLLPHLFTCLFTQPTIH